MACNSYLPYLADCFEKLNDFNLSLQGRNTNISILSDKEKAFATNIDLWKNEVMSGNYEMFPCFAQFVDENEVDFEQVKVIVKTNLTNQQSNF